MTVKMASGILFLEVCCISFLWQLCWFPLQIRSLLCYHWFETFGHALSLRKRVSFTQCHLNLSHAATFNTTSQIDCAFSVRELKPGRVSFTQCHLNLSHAATFSTTSQIDCAFSVLELKPGRVGSALF